jgi:hypothetical protein
MCYGELKGHLLASGTGNAQADNGVQYTAKKMHGKLRVVQLVILAQKLMTLIFPF